MTKKARGRLYTLGFAAAVCLVCSVVVATSAVLLRPRQERAERLDRQRRVLAVTGLLDEDTVPSDAEIERLFAAHVHAVVVELGTGAVIDDADPLGFDPRAAVNDPAASRVAPPNAAGIDRLPLRSRVFHVLDAGGETTAIVVPVEGRGLWSTLYGYLALDVDGVTIVGLTFYQHGETPGLGGEVDNPRWRALWQHRRAFDESGEVAIEVVRGSAGPADRDPYHVDGLSGATLTSNGVTELVRFWLGPHGFGPYLRRVRGEVSS